MDLTAQNVETILSDVLFTDEEAEKIDPENSTDPKEVIKVQGIVNHYGFHPKRLMGHQDDLKSMAANLPESFFASTGGGWSFLNVVSTKDGELWTGLHQTAEQFVCMLIGIGQAKWVLPRDMWASLPGGMPYLVLEDQP